MLCWIFNIRGMRPAVGLSYVVGALMIIPILVIAIGGFVTGDFQNHEINSNFIAANVEFYGDSPTFFNQFVMVMVWMYILGWSTYGPEAGATFAPEYKDTANDTRKALASVGALNVFLSILLPIVVLGTIGYDALFADTTGVVWLTDVVNSIAGEGFGKFLVVCLCAGLLLSMNTATMDGSRALYALSEEKMTIKQLGTLNRHNVPGRAMTVDMLLNIFLLLMFQNIYFILAAGNLGYMLSHVIALSGVLLLRRDRPNWPRPIKLGESLDVAGRALLRPERDLHHLRGVRAQVHGLRLRLPEPGIRRGHGQPDGARALDHHRRRPRARVRRRSATSSPSGSGARRCTGRIQATSSRRRRRSTAQPPSPPAPASRNANRPGEGGETRPLRVRGLESAERPVAIPITVRCECGETHSAKLGETVECSCGRSYDTSQVSESNFPQVRAHQAKARLYVRVGAIFLIVVGVVSFFLWGLWGAAVTVPIAGMLWFWYIRRWFMRKFVPSPGELPTLELEATRE